MAYKNTLIEKKTKKINKYGQTYRFQKSINFIIINKYNTHSL